MYLKMKSKERFIEEFLRKGFLKFSVSKIPERYVCHEKKERITSLKKYRISN